MYKSASVTLIRDDSINQDNIFNKGNVTSAYEQCLMELVLHAF